MSYPQTDIDFYLMKITRLESDLAATQQELMNARLRLRTAEDYEIKYELLLKQSEQEHLRLKILEREEEQKLNELLVSKIEEREVYWASRIAEIQRDIKIEYETKLKSLEEQIQVLKLRRLKSERKGQEYDLLLLKLKTLQKDKQDLEEQLEDANKNHERVLDYKIQELKAELADQYSEAAEKQRKIYDYKIESMENQLHQMKQRERDVQIMRTSPDPVEPMLQLKDEIEGKLAANREQLQRMNEVSEEKDKKMNEILEEMVVSQQSFINEKKELKEYIKVLEEQAYEREQQHQDELVNLKERMAKIRDEEVQNLKLQLNKASQAFNAQRSAWDDLLESKRSQEIKKKHVADSNQSQWKKQKEMLNNTIQELRKRLREGDDQKEGECTQNLINSLKDIDRKHTEFSNYESGVLFLDRQLKIATAKIQEKNLEIGRLLKAVAQSRTEAQSDIQAVRTKAKSDKKYLTDKVCKLEVQTSQLHEQLRDKQRHSKRRQSQLEGQIQKLKIEYKSLQEIHDELKRDYHRMSENKKDIESSYRDQKEKSFTGKSDMSTLKKQRWVQLEVQKNQLGVVFRQREQELKVQAQLEIEALRHQRDNLRRDNQRQKGVIQSLKNQKDSQKKQNKYADYQKKIATLNLQISLAKNIYESLKEVKQHGSRRSDKILRQEESDGQSTPLLDIQGGSPYKELRMSFDPKMEEYLHD